MSVLPVRRRVRFVAFAMTLAVAASVPVLLTLVQET